MLRAVLVWARSFRPGVRRRGDQTAVPGGRRHRRRPIRDNQRTGAAVDPELTVEQVAYQRRVLVTHTNDPETGLCPVCGVPRCRDWLSAYDTLAAAGQTMTDEPPPWK